MFETQIAALAERDAVLAERDAALESERLARSHLERELADARADNERLTLLLKEYERARYGRRSEKLDPDQLHLALEEIEVAIAEVQEGEDQRRRQRGEGTDEATSRRAGRGVRAFPAELPHVERVIEPADLTCACGCGQMVKIGEDRSKRLDLVPAQYRVIVTVRPRYACPKGCAGVVQSPAPAHLIEGGIPTEALLAHVAVAKYSEHMPLYRQAQVFARHGVPVSRSVFADWMGGVSFHVAPVVERMDRILRRSGKLFMDETTAPVLDPGRGRTKTGYLWALARDDRSWSGGDPPGVVFHYAPGRGGEHAERFLDGFEGILQVDGYGGYRRLARAERKGGAPLTLAFCWSHGRREIIKATPKAGSPVADAVLSRIAELYRIEAGIRGSDAGKRRLVRQEASRPLIDELAVFLRAQAQRLSPKSPMGGAVAYLLNHWDGLCVFLDDGRVEMDSNSVENLIRPLTLNRKNALFAGHDEGGRTWARLASLIGTCKLNGVEPYAYMKALLEAIAAGHPQSRIDELLPWNFKGEIQTA
jgi:transposase